VSIVYIPQQYQRLTGCHGRVAFCEWIVDSMRPVRIVKDRGLHTIVKTGRPGYEIPSESTVRRDLDVIFDVVEERVGNLLRVS
jgi:hypothetical protein